jgi:hypothetical protein
MSRSTLCCAALAALTAFFTVFGSPAHASVHLMQVQRMIGGVNGDTTAQAIQLRMRSSFQTQTQTARLVVRNAAGAAPVVLATPVIAVTNGGAGVNVLFATVSFAAQTDPPAVADFTMSAIPAAYLAAGSLTFESNLGSIFWRVSWGGAGYTGPGSGTVFNDIDGKFNPAFGGALPSAMTMALSFTGSATALSTNNAANYAVSAPLPTFRNNAGTGFTIVDTATPAPALNGLVARLLPAVPNPFNPQTKIRFDLPRAGQVSLRVYALDGTLVDVLHDGLLSAGRGSVTWTGVDRKRRPVASGVYVVRLLSLDGAASRRVTLVK